MSNLSIWAARALTPTGLRTGVRVRTADGRIASIEPAQSPRASDIAFPDATLVPGFIDLQANGGAGAAFDDPDPEVRQRAARYHLASGTTCLLATLVTAPIESLVASLERLRNDLRSPRDDGAPNVLGVHLEGPFLSPHKSGAHAASHLALPTPEAVDSLLCGGDRSLRMVTLAPELEGSLDAVEGFARAGAVVCAGHSMATLAQVRAAIARGLSFVTHVGNACDWPSRPHDPQWGYRRSEPGVVGAFLCDDRLRGSVILDGHHLHPELVRALVRARGVGSIALVSDASPAAGLEPGQYRLGGLETDVHEGGYATSGEGLAGSVVPLVRTIRVAVREAGLPIDVAVRMATSTPADVLGVGLRKGRLRPGADADMVVLDSELDVRAVFLAGRPFPRE